MSAKDNYPVPGLRRDMVSRETPAFAGASIEADLEIYEATLLQWQERINLVSETTLPDLWNRHFMDSFQLVAHIQNVSRETSDFTLADLGSGAGFPGMVLAIAGIPNVNLIESDQRKCAFLREIARKTAKKVTIHNERIEKLAIKANVITSRAFADLTKTFEVSKNLCLPDTQYLLLKPLDIEKELTEATKSWYFSHEIIPSVSDPRGCILRIFDLRHR